MSQKIDVETVSQKETTKVEESSGPRFPITKAAIVDTCVKHGLYRTPSCNEKLYLHHKGFDKIQDLEEYTAVRVLWLEGNCFHEIENLSTLKELRQLYLHQNCLGHIQGLEGLTQLVDLNVSDNFIKSVSGLSDQADSLKMLQIKNNQIKLVEDVNQLATMKKLSVLDISHNKIEDGQGFLELLQKLPELKSLYLMGNPCVRTISNYRKTVLSKLPNLVYLDEKPVFPDERRLVTAWSERGLEGEREERKKMKEEEEQKLQQRLAEFRRMKQGGRDQSPEGSETESETTETETDDDDDPVVTPEAPIAVPKTATVHADPMKAVQNTAGSDEDDDEDVYVPK